MKKIIPVSLLALAFVIVFGCGRQNSNPDSNHPAYQPPAQPPAPAPGWQPIGPNQAAFGPNQRILVNQGFNFRPNDPAFQPFMGAKFSHVVFFHGGQALANTDGIPPFSPFCALATNEVKSPLYHQVLPTPDGAHMRFVDNTIITFGSGNRSGVTPIAAQNRSLYYDAEKIVARHNHGGPHWHGWVFCGVFSDRMLIGNEGYEFQKRSYQLLGAAKSSKILETFGQNARFEMPLPRPR